MSRIIVVICKGVVSLLLAAFISFCLSGVQDSTGTKSGLKRVAVSYLLSYALYLVLTTLFGRTALSATNADVFGNLLILGFHAVFHFAITEPVVRAKRFAAESSPETYQDIHPFLSVPKWFDALYQHAITECNAENLLFWKSVQECDNGTASPIKRLSRIRSSRSLRRLGVKSDQPQMQFIYNTFIAPGAPLEVCSRWRSAGMRHQPDRVRLGQPACRRDGQPPRLFQRIGRTTRCVLAVDHARVGKFDPEQQRIHRRCERDRVPNSARLVSPVGDRGGHSLLRTYDLHRHTAEVPLDSSGEGGVGRVRSQSH